MFSVFNMRRRSQTLLVLLFVFITISIWNFWPRKHKTFHYNDFFPNQEKEIVRASVEIHKHVKVVIGVVTCRKDNSTENNVETTVLIKSVLISAKLYGVTEINVHIFLEYTEDSQIFKNALQEFGYPTKQINIKLFFHSAVEVVPEYFRNDMIYNSRLRCTYARLYFPHALRDVDSIIYFDTDFIITGNIASLWKHFDKMNDQQLVGVVPNNSPKLHVKYYMHNCFKNGHHADIPFVKPKGLNAGLLLMNLTKMRQYQWEERISTVYKSYINMYHVDDQKILNIFLHDNPDLLYLLPCQFNIRCSSCNHALLCDDVERDPYGIQCIHGASNQFKTWGRFHYIYKQYLEFNIRKDDVMKDLMIPIVNAKEPRSETGDQKCDTPVNQYLYLNIFNQNFTI